MIAFQGERGAYSEAAALAFFGAQTETLPCDTFETVFQAVDQGEAEHGLIPIENSLAGSIHRNYDLLLRYQIPITGEVHHRIRHCLLALPDVEMTDLRRVMSHPQALAQCEQYLSRLNEVEIVSEQDTAGSARIVSERGLRNTAAIASKHASEVYGMQVLAEGIEDDPANFTRFLSLGGELPKSGPGSKTSIVFALENQPGALSAALAPFARRGIDLAKIESRPLIGKPWEYLFYLDIVGAPGDEAASAGLAELKAITTEFRILGTYPQHRFGTD